MKKISFIVTGLTIIMTGVVYLVNKKEKQPKYAVVPPEKYRR